MDLMPHIHYGVHGLMGSNEIFYVEGKENYETLYLALEQRIKELKTENARLQKTLDGYSMPHKMKYYTEDYVAKLREAAEKDKGICQCPHDDNWDCQYHEDGGCTLKQALAKTTRGL